MAEIELKNIEEAQRKLAELRKDGSINKPSDKEVKNAAKEFKKAKDAFENKKFVIGTSEVAKEIYNFMLDFMEHHVFWTKNGWMGVIRMHAELFEMQKSKKEEPFAIGYQALEFMLFALTNPGGFGLKSAQMIDKVQDFYIDLVEMVGKKVEETREELKSIQWLGDKAASMQQGFYLEKEPTQGDGSFAPPTIEDLLKKD